MALPPTTPFDYRSGHINLAAAFNPGLIYDFNSNDIINFLCSNGATPAQLKNLTGELVQCKKPALHLPTILIILQLVLPT